ncbi:MAG TPA: DUF6152 family protein [Gammaproteobacteria bacterium]|nr:DUF6152 family protein [Gammaproteobacteria bacterium]
MKTRAAAWAAFAALVWTCSLAAHHSVSMFDVSTPIWVKGTVVGFELINPHAMILLEETSEGGTISRLSIEGPGIHPVRRSFDPESDLVQAGDVIEVCAFALKAEFASGRARPDSGDYPRRFLHGHVLVMPDGQRRLFGSYGNLGACIRSDDEQRDAWLRFLNAGDMRLRNLWCGQRSAQRRGADESTAESIAFVEEINGLLDDPCR